MYDRMGDDLASIACQELKTKVTCSSCLISSEIGCAEANFGEIGQLFQKAPTGQQGKGAKWGI